jgi:hypothetical protein
MKLFLSLAALLFGVAHLSLAQTARPAEVVEKVHRFVEGNNTVVIPNKGTVRFGYRDGKLINPTFQDTAGKSYKLGIGGATGDPTEGAPGCKDNCDGCTGGCHKVCIDYYCCYGCAGNTLTSASGGGTPTSEPTVNINIVKAR